VFSRLPTHRETDREREIEIEKPIERVRRKRMNKVGATTPPAGPKCIFR